MSILKSLICLSIPLVSSAVFAATPQTLWPNIPYGTHALQKLNFYQPASDKPVKGLAIWIHGGGWSGGDKEDPALEYFRPAFDRGLAVISINYRLTPEGAFPNSVNDVLSVLNAVEKGGCADCSYTGNPAIWSTIQNYSKKGIMISGGSAGGHLATYAGAFHVKNNSTTNLKCINNNAGPVDLRPLKLYSKDANLAISSFAGGDLSASKLANMSPTAHAEKGYFQNFNKKVKWFLNYNIGDTIIPVKTTTSFTTILRNNGAIVYSSVVNEPGPLNSHNVSSNTASNWIKTAVSSCFTM